MAERGAYLTATSQAKPSIFEVVAQDSLSVTFHPALKRVATFLATCNPDRYGWLVNWFEEVYFAFNTILQFHYLRNHGASFAEAFYDLQRIPLRGISSTFPRLPPREEAMSLVCLCLVPYLRAKLEDRITQYQLEGIPRGWGQVLLRLHSALHLVWESSILGNYLYYMSGNTSTHSPLLRLAGVTLQYAADMEEETKYPLWSAKSLKYVLMRTMELGAFFLQFLQWWHAEDKLRSSFTALPLPPAPEVSAEAKQYSGICPICLQNRKIETVLPVSGYVFCYRCIVQYVQEHHSCPVTKYPADMRDLIRVYASDS
ncbi:peroxisome assembly protein 12-A [Periplaneta americana]|uniref:peroxisome assembly protein 12-A n=1 Tax=Periplaneta americana TaxID=6978 RepID=UPI0037E79E45